MQITIGEVVNELSKYSNLVETSITNGMPFVRAFISSSTSHTKLYMYVAQIKDGIYSVCDDISDTNGSRFFPTGNPNKPFIREIERVHIMYGGSGTIDDSWSMSVSDVDYPDFVMYLYQRLKDLKMLKISQKILDSNVVSLGFNSIRIQRIIEKGFNEKNIRNGGTVEDLVKIVNKDKESFSLHGLRNKDIQCIVSKLEDVGLNISTRGGYIVDTTFVRR